MDNEAATQLIQVLEKTISPDQKELQAAQQFLEQASSNNLPELLKTLSDILVHGGNSSIARRQAGLQLKNYLYSNEESVKLKYQERWLQINPSIRDYIKSNILGALGSEGYRPSAAAQCIQHVALFELPQNLWPTLMQSLVNNVTDPSSTELCREATLEAIGYICQEVDTRFLEDKSNEILTAIVHGMKKDEPSNHVKLAATQALHNSLEFTRANFEKDTERHFIMQVVCEATQTTDIKVKVAALQCLVKIMSLYYQYMESYMGPALFVITLEAMRSDEDDVALQGIEFWSNVCDEEVDLQIEAQEAQEAGKPPTQVSRFYAKGALQYIVPILLQTLTKQEEYDDEDEWKPCKAASVCLMLLATCCEDDIVPHILPFVKENIKHADWRLRDAALMAFGTILEGPDPSNLNPIVMTAMPMLIELMCDNSVVVKDTAAWTIGRICEINSEAAINEQYIKPLLEALVNGLSSEPRVAANVCWAFNSLSEAAYDSALSLANSGESPNTYLLSAYFDVIIEKLLATTDRPDASQANLRASAYEALMEMIKNSPKDCYVTVQKTIVIIMERLQRVQQMESRIQSQSDRLQYNDLQSLLCATLQSVLRKVEPEHAPQISDQVMTSLLQMFQSSLSTQTGGVQEDALLAIGTMVEVLQEGFAKYMDALKPFLIASLKNVAEYQVCHAAVGLIGDICRSLSSGILPMCDEVMQILLENLSNNDVHRLVKPPIISVFGDIALAIGVEFKKYLEIVMQTLMQASQAQVDRSNYDMIDYLADLRESCLDAYTGIIQGLKGTSTAENPTPEMSLIHSHVTYIVQFIIIVGQDPDVTDSNIAAAAGCVGDLCLAFGGNVLPFVDVDQISELLTRGRRSKSAKTKTLSQWATKEIRKLKNANANTNWVTKVRPSNHLVKASNNQSDVYFSMRVHFNTRSFIRQEISEESFTLRLQPTATTPNSIKKPSLNDEKEEEEIVKSFTATVSLPPHNNIDNNNYSDLTNDDSCSNLLDPRFRLKNRKRRKPILTNRQDLVSTKRNRHNFQDDSESQ